MRVHTLLRIDSRIITDDRSEVRAFVQVRDEIIRLPQFIEHHRKIGVARFFITDNGSTDGSRDFLLAQPDCHVFVTSNSYAESYSGLDWQTALLNEYGTNHWCLSVDADEWFTYPGYESLSLSELAAYLTETGSQGVFAFMLDLYGAGSIPASAPTQTQASSLLDACPYFDSDYEWRKATYISKIEKPPFPEYNIVGGPRLRLFYPHFSRYQFPLRVLWSVLSRLKIPIPASLKIPPTLTKVPFVHWAPGMRYDKPHATKPIKLSEVTGVLLHFKFLQDFYARIRVEAERKEHWDGAAEHERYLNKLKQDPQSLSFYYPGSRAYVGSEQLVELGLLREDDGWQRRRSSARAALTALHGCHTSPETRQNAAPKA
jgi:hypothetical protein